MVANASLFDHTPAVDRSGAHSRQGVCYSDDWRNGVPLCHTHHAGFDGGLFDIEPETLRIGPCSGDCVELYRIDRREAAYGSSALHIDALRWRWNSSQQVSMSIDKASVAHFD